MLVNIPRASETARSEACLQSPCTVTVTVGYRFFAGAWLEILALNNSRA